MFPKGFGGVLVAMGLTFIAFEGYDLIATVSEEVKEPTKNIPKATFISLGIAVTIYLLILLVSIGAVDPTKFDVYGQMPDQLPAEMGITGPTGSQRPRDQHLLGDPGHLQGDGHRSRRRELYAHLWRGPHCLWRAVFHHVGPECQRPGLFAGGL